MRRPAVMRMCLALLVLATAGCAKASGQTLEPMGDQFGKGVSASASGVSGSTSGVSSSASGVPSSTPIATGPASEVAARMSASDQTSGQPAQPASPEQQTSEATPKAAPSDEPTSTEAPIPPGSGSGPRLIWSKGANRVWIVDAAEKLLRTYPVTDLDFKTPIGIYHVVGKRARSTAVVAGETWYLAFFVKFYKRCPSCDWIGFHAIPVNGRGEMLQDPADLGTDKVQSHGCIRQELEDARFLWDHSAIGTAVVVVK